MLFQGYHIATMSMPMQQTYRSQSCSLLWKQGSTDSDYYTEAALNHNSMGFLATLFDNIAMIQVFTFRMLTFR